MGTSSFQMEKIYIRCLTSIKLRQAISSSDPGKNPGSIIIVKPIFMMLVNGNPAKQYNGMCNYLQLQELFTLLSSIVLGCYGRVQLAMVCANTILLPANSKRSFFTTVCDGSFRVCQMI